MHHECLHIQLRERERKEGETDRQTCLLPKNVFLSNYHLCTAQFSVALGIFEHIEIKYVAF